MGGKAATPPAPDYLGAATAQAQASEKATRAQNFANRPEINTPFGTQSWNTKSVTDPSSGELVTQWTQNTTLAPGLADALDYQLDTQLGRSRLASGFMDRVADEYRPPFNEAALPRMAEVNAPASLRANITDYTPGLSTDVDSRSGQTVSGFNFSNPTLSMTPMTSGLVSAVDAGGPQQSITAMTGNMVDRVTPTSVNQSFDSLSNNVQRTVPSVALNANFSALPQSLRRDTDTQVLQRNLAVADNPALPQFDSSYRDTVFTQLMERMQPIHAYQQQQLETRLANQGFMQGSEAYRRALDELNQRQAAERYNALDTAGNEAQRLYNMGMGARQQAFNEDVAGGQFTNAAANQAFQQALNANQFANQAAGQAFSQGLQAQQAQNQALGQQFNQNLAAGQFGNSAVQQAYAQGLGATQAANQAAAQQFNQALAAGQFQNQANQQAYNQTLGAANFGNQAQQQRYNQLLGQAALNNQTAQQAYNQTLGAFNFGNQAQQQLFNQNLAQANLNNQAQQQAFGQDLQARQFQNQALGQASALDLARMNAVNQAIAQQQTLNQSYADSQNRLRQQAIAEQMQRRGMSLNEMNALLSGQQVNLPQMPSFQPAGRAETPNILGATQMGYDAALGAANAQNAAFGNLLGAGAQLGAAAIPFMFSDRRLKSNICRVGTHATGVGIYDFIMMGMPQRGVIAQEVAQVRPDLVRRHASGYLMVDYGGLA